MNDDELMTAVRKSFTDVHSATPVEQIVNRSRAVHTRRWIPAMAAALAMVAAAAIAVTTLLPGHQPSRPVTVQLAAWTVVKQADGTVYVTVRELRDPAGLQRTLRADGIPASVTFAGQPNPACRPYVHRLRQGVVAIEVAPVYRAPNVLIFHPSDLPPDAGWQIVSGFNLPGRPGITVFSPTMVYASSQCTGS
jgi:hypothetical protein